jgi:hypothetical protein
VADQARLELRVVFVPESRLIEGHVAFKHEVVKTSNSLLSGFDLQELNFPAGKASLDQATMKTVEPGV